MSWSVAHRLGRGARDCRTFTYLYLPPTLWLSDRRPYQWHGPIDESSRRPIGPRRHGGDSCLRVLAHPVITGSIEAAIGYPKPNGQNSGRTALIGDLRVACTSKLPSTQSGRRVNRITRFGVDSLHSIRHEVGVSPIWIFRFKLRR